METPAAPALEASLNWHAANSAALSARLAWLRGLLAARSSGQEAPPVQPAAWDLPQPPAFERLAAVFGLSDFERDLLLLCAGCELEADFPGLCAAAQGDPRRTYPTFGLALALLSEPDSGLNWSALTPGAPLRRWRLLETGSSLDPLAASPLRIDERVLFYLLGVDSLDVRLQGLCLGPIPAPAEDELPPSQAEFARQAVRAWSEPPLPVIFLCGERSSAALTAQALSALACHALGTSLYRLRAAEIPALGPDREFLARLWEREAALAGAVLFLDAFDEDDTRRAAAFIETLNAPVLVGLRQPFDLPTGRASLRLDLPRPGPAEQRPLWLAVLGPRAEQLNGSLEALVSQFNLSPTAMRAALSRAAARASTDEDLGRELWEACRVQARSRLDDLAQRIQTSASWEDLVLPESQRQSLLDLAAQVRQRSLVYEQWGMSARSGRSLGISALFAGASGTGKTLAAEVLANTLRLDLYRIDLSAVVSKYIGETEKNLRQVFDTAEDSGAILLFDEADALFGRRSEVKDSHDRYANIEVSYLLQRMEAYRGLAILTTNLRGALDPAFLRRIRFIVNFPFPDAGQRAEIWRRMFPAQLPCEGLDHEKLARLSIAGGNIRNIALNAAFIAADEGGPLRMAHLLRAARSEYAKLDKSLSEIEAGGWI